ncbi:hypothetical protein PMALA_067700, partial [Plasmodium malariae]
FTRMKSWLSNQLIRKKIIVLNEVQEGTREYIQNINVEVNRNYERIVHNIGYHPQ